MKIIHGDLQPFSGTYRCNTSIHIQYIPQGLKEFFVHKTLLENFYDLGADETTIRQYLGSVFIRRDKVHKPLVNFSQGELVRAAIIKCILKQAEFLLLDEPTSHLDIESIEVLERLLEQFPGGYMIISHDRLFVEHVAERLYQLEGSRLRLV